MYKKYKTVMRAAVCLITVIGVNVFAQEFNLGEGRVVSVKQKNHEAASSDGEYLSEIVLKVGAEPLQVIDKIYFYAESARISDAFYMDMDFDGVSELALISLDEVFTDPMEGNVGPYIDVRVYKAKGDRFEKSEKLSTIFSGGIDKAVDSTAEKLVYKFIYPHKTKKDIEEFVSTPLYKEFSVNNGANYIFQSKTTIYKEPFVFD